MATHAIESGESSIRKIVEGLSKKQNGVFGPMLNSFISCTLSGKLQDPFKVLRNIRQFISGLKNYLVGVSPESEMIHQEIKNQSVKLRYDALIVHVTWSFLSMIFPCTLRYHVHLVLSHGAGILQEVMYWGN